MFQYQYMMMRICPVVCLAAAVLLPAKTLSADEKGYDVGVAEINVTPDYPIRLNGFGGRRDESEGVTQPIWAKALAIGADAEKPVVLITLDSCGVRLSMVEEVAKRLKEKAGIERDRFALTFTHSHTTPKLRNVCDTVFSTPIPPEHQEHIDRYDRELTDALEKVALAALADRKLAKLEWAVGKVGFAKNRRTEGGPVDHDLPMLVVKSADSNSIRAVYVTYACHCVTLSNNRISGDWAGYAAEAIERNHPDAIALVSIGCGSDSNPTSGVTGDNIGAASEQGAEISREVDRLLQGALRPVSGAITATLRNIDLPLKKLPTREELEAIAANDTPEGYNATFQLAKLDRDEPLQSKIDYPIQTWSFGDSLAMVFLGGEVCVDYSLRLKQELDSDLVWIHAYSNDFCCYVPSERLLREGGYGGGAETVYFALPTTLLTGLEEKIIDEVHRQVPKQFHAKTAAESGGNLQPTTAADALAAIQTHDSLVVELVAAEPLIADPVAIDFGADGRLWVVEMTDYSHEVDDKFDQTGSVKSIVDENGDGVFDKAESFVTDLRFPTDVKVWGKGVIVCDAPDVIYFEDTDGDGQADLRKVLLTGFATHNAQARVNSLRWGLDNWIYGSCGLFGGQSIRSFNGQSIELGGRDFRFKPDTGEIEAVAGCTQQGRARDDWGNWFGCESGALCDHYPLSDRYLSRNPYVAPPAPDVAVPAGRDANRLFPIGDTVMFKESGPPGRPTSACGLGIYGDDLLGPQFRGNVFVAEPVNQLVHRRVLTPNGVTFVGERAEEEANREFLASADNWFRPVQIRTGTDGCLWIVDMCRYVIEHPRFIPVATLSQLDPMAGRTAGRIFRVRPRDQQPRQVVRFDALDTPGLVAAIESPNGPQRDLAHQILVQRGDATAVPLLEKLASAAERPEARLQAMCALDGLSALSEKTLTGALQDSHAGVRRHAIRLSEPYLHKSEAVSHAVLALASDDDPQVQLQLAYSLGEWSDPRAADSLAMLAWRHHADPYLMAAILSSVSTKNAMEVAHGISSAANGAPLPQSLSDGLVMMIAKLGDHESLVDSFETLSQFADDVPSQSQLETLAKLLESLDAKQRQALVDDESGDALVDRIVESARRIVQDSAAVEGMKLTALRILAATHVDDDDLIVELGDLLGPHSPPAVQHAAITLLAKMNARGVGETLLANWTSYTPSVRTHVLDVMYSRREFLPILLASIESGDIKATQFDALQRQRLLTHSDEAIRTAAAAAFAGPIGSDRKKIVDSFASAARAQGNAVQGRAVFQKHCASCHQLEGSGHKVGPDLAAVTSRTPAALLEAVFDPNRTVDERYQNYTAITDEGRVFTGVLARETSNSVTLLEQEGKEHTLLRNTLDQFENSGVSLMPEGFEKDLSTADVSDLFSYLTAQVVPPKQIAGNQPEMITADGDGVFWLIAANGAVYGNDVTFEAPHQNIGYWHGSQDYVAWDLGVESEGSFDVYLNWACADDTAGNVALVEGLDAPLRVVIRSTGGFDRYETTKLGTARLLPGSNCIIVRSDGAMTTRSLMDLRGLYLVPAGQASERAEAGAAPNLKLDDAASAIIARVRRTNVGTPAEYQSIPDIWEIALGAGRRNNSDEIARVLAIAMPKSGEPMRDWQAVVLGGGIVNGLSQVGCSPRVRILELLEGKASLQASWNRSIELAARMADDESVRIGTRYDSLRILGADTFERAGASLTKYLRREAPEELEMGAVSGLTDMECSAAWEAIIAVFSDCRRSNQTLAIAGLSRDQARISALLDAIEAGKIPSEALSTKQWAKLKKSTSQELRKRVEAAHQGVTKPEVDAQSAN